MTTKTSLKKLAIAGGRYMSLTGNDVVVESHPKDSTVLLRIKLTNGVEVGIGYWPNHVAEAILSALSFYDGAMKQLPAAAQPIPCLPSIAVPANLFVAPEIQERMKVPMLDKDSYYKLVESVNQDILHDMINSFLRHVDYMITANIIVNPTEEFQMDIDSAGRYMDVFGRKGMWSDLRAMRNIVILLKKYRHFVMEGITQEYLLGRKIFPVKLGVPLV